jgi:8-oxo-dGTP pyrophosphatase MutT (NUDIX family)
MKNNPLQIVSVIIVIRDVKGRYLLVQRSDKDDIFPGKWQNVGGKVELGETVEKAIKREVFEETSIKLPNDSKPIFLMSYNWKKDDTSPYRLGLIFMVVTKESISVSISEEDDLQDYGWFAYKEILALDTIGKDSPTGTLGQIKVANKN